MDEWNIHLHFWNVFLLQIFNISFMWAMTAPRQNHFESDQLFDGVNLSITMTINAYFQVPQNLVMVFQ